MATTQRRSKVSVPPDPGYLRDEGGAIIYDQNADPIIVNVT